MHRLRKYLHRCVGGSVVIAGLLAQLKEVDLSQLVGDHYGPMVIAAIGVTVIGLEFMPVVEKAIEGDDKQEDPQ